MRRLAHHPSLIVWCGNNEMEEGNYHWGFEKGVAHPDYVLFHMVLPIILKEEDGTRYYQPTSPYSPDLESPRRDDMGDQHPWTVGLPQHRVPRLPRDDLALPERGRHPGADGAAHGAGLSAAGPTEAAIAAGDSAKATRRCCWRGTNTTTASPCGATTSIPNEMLQRVAGPRHRGVHRRGVSSTGAAWCRARG